MHALLQDPFIAAEIDRALAPYAGRLPAAEVAWMRAELAESLATGPAAELLRRAHPRVGDRSGEVASVGEAAVRPGIRAARRGKAG